MATALEIITDAYREGNLIGIGVVPNEPQQVEGLRLLNTVISSALGFEIGEGLMDWRVGTSNTADDEDSLTEQVWTRPGVNARILLNIGTPQTIFFPGSPSDGSRMSVIDVLGSLSMYPVTLSGNGINIEDEPSIVVNEDGLNRTWFYRADLGSWMRVAALAIDDPMPFPTEHDDAFITMTAMRLNPRYGRSMDQQSIAWMERSLRSLRARYRQKVIVAADPGVLARTNIGPGSFGTVPRRLSWMS